MNKSEQREMLKNLRSAMTPEEVTQKSTAVAEKLFSLDAFDAAKTILVYISLAKEVSTDEIIAECRRRGKRVLVPITVSGNIIPCVFEENTALVRGGFGIREPAEKIPWRGGIDMAIIPGLGFDKTGARIGFGKGCYDKFLAENPCIKLGIAFSHQIFDKIITDSYDVPMDIIVTDKEMYFP